MSSAIEVYNKIQDPFAAAISIGQHFARSGMFGVEKTEAGTILALACIVENKSPFNIARRFHIIDGKLNLKASAILADFRKAGGRHKWIKTGEDGIEAEIELTFEGNVIRSKFTIEDAKRMELIRPRSNWIKSPANMLRARAITNGVGMLCPEITSGDDEESDDTPKAGPSVLAESIAPTTPSTIKRENIVDAEIVPPKEAPKPETSPALTPPETTPTPSTPPAQKIVAATSKESLPGDSLFREPLSVETTAALLAIFGDKDQAVVDWMLKKNWLKMEKLGGDKETFNIRLLSVQRAQKILDKPAEFMAAVTKADGK